MMAQRYHADVTFGICRKNVIQPFRVRKKSCINKKIMHSAKSFQSFGWSNKLAQILTTPPPAPCFSQFGKSSFVCAFFIPQNHMIQAFKHFEFSQCLCCLHTTRVSNIYTPQGSKQFCDVREHTANFERLQQ